MIIRRVGIAILTFLFAAVALATEVTSEEAAQAVGTWIGLRAQLGCRLGEAVAEARTCSPTNGVSFHVVKLEGGGFVVTSSDTEIEPILAFSESDDLVESEENPLWVMLRKDLAARSVRRRQVHAASSVAASAAVAQSEASAKWARLLPAKSANGLMRSTQAATGKTTLSDIRVEPLLQTKWNQEQDSYYSNMGDPCYNYYTPNNYPCGCVATAGAQVMRYHRFPTAYVTPGTYACRVETGKDWINAYSYYPIYEDRNLTMKGGYYDWDSMPLVPDDGTTLSQRQAIGKLTSDVGITCLMAYGEDGSSSAGYMLSRSLPERFGYASAVAYCGSGISSSIVRKTLVSNLDAKLPVVMGLDGYSGGHAVVCDGYGYSASTFYAHFNMGWAGEDDAWYAPPNIGEDFYSVDTFVYNIYPKGVAGGVICSGRVLSSSGSPVSGATVSASGTSSATTTSDEKGIYAFILSPGSYTISSGTASKSVTLVANVGSSVTDTGFYWTTPSPKVNNVCDCDLTVSGTTPVVTHTVTFVLGTHGTHTGGGALTQTVTDGAAATAPTFTVEEGWEFTGWSRTFSNVTSDITVTAQYKSVTVYRTVTFNANGGSVSEGSRQVAKGSEVGNLPTATRGNYTFDGWYTSASGGTKLTASTVVTADVTWYAHWTKVVVTHTVTFVLGTHGTRTGGGALTQTVTDGAAATAPTFTVEEGWEFTGWSRTFSNVTSDITVTAQYAYVEPEEPEVTVKLTIGNGFTYDPETGDAVSTVKRTSGEIVELRFDESKIVDRSGNRVGAFQKWIVEPADADLGETFDPYTAETFIAVPDVDIKVTAQYVAKVGAYVAYEFGADGDSDEWDGSFCWSPDGGETLVESGVPYPLAAGKVSVSFYAIDAQGEASQLWIAPNDATLTVPSRSSSSSDITELWLTEWFVLDQDAQRVTFDANGGSCSCASRWYRDGGAYYALPSATGKSGFAFGGWWTEKTGGVRVYETDEVDFSLFEGTPRLYAHWAKAFKLTLKGMDAMAWYNDEEYENSVTVLSGDSVALSAPESYDDVRGTVYLFKCWTPSKTYDFGGEYSAASCDTTIAMPAANLTMTATYVKESEAAYMTMCAYADSLEIGGETVEAEESDLLWSTDGKTWYASGERVLVKKGTYSVQWKSASGVWAGPTTKTKVTLAAGDEYDNSDDPAEFTFVLAACATAVVYEDGVCNVSSAGGTATVSPADGRLASGKSMTLTAKANKGYAFVGWLHDSGWEDGCSMSYYLYSMNASQKVTYLDEEMIDARDFKLHFYAVFRPISDYTPEGVSKLFSSVTIGSRSVEANYDEDEFSGTVEVKAGLGCSTIVAIDQEGDGFPLTYSVSGNLPKGLKLDKTYGYITGTPTAAGRYDFVVTAKDPAGNACKLAVTMTVSSVFGPIVGNWRALLMDESDAYAGILEMSVTDKGKASGKIITATGTTSVTPSVTWTADEDDPDGEGLFEICYGKSTGTEKSGSYVYFDVSPSEGTVTYESKTWKNGEETSSAVLAGSIIHADSSMLADSDFAEAFLNKYYTVALAAGEGDGADGYRTPSELMANGYLTVTVDKKGTVKVTGKLPDGEKISASTVLLPSCGGDSASAMMFVVPSSYKKKGSVALQLEFDSAGSVSASVGTWKTPPLLDAISGVEDDSEIFLPGLLSLSANGAVYSKLNDLTDYYGMSIAVSPGDSVPMLEYSTTYSDAGVKRTEYNYAEALLEIGKPELTGGKNGKVTVGKSAAPWKDSEGQYHYDWTKEDKFGNSQEITNPSGLTLSFKSATGIFSGKFNVFFDWETYKWNAKTEEDVTVYNHKAVSCAYEGVVINDGGSSPYGAGSAVYSGKYTFPYTYEDKKGNEKSATKAYTQKFALPVTWTIE